MWIFSAFSNALLLRSVPHTGHGFFPLLDLVTILFDLEFFHLDGFHRSTNALAKCVLRLACQKAIVFITLSMAGYPVLSLPISRNGMELEEVRLALWQEETTAPLKAPALRRMQEPKHGCPMRPSQCGSLCKLHVRP